MRLITTLAVILGSATLAWGQAKSVIVAPFEEADEHQQADWVSRSLHQSLVNDVAAMADVTVLNASQPANPSDARYIIRPTLQRSDGVLRITGRIEETGSGRTIGGFKASGSERELFAIQDSIAAQVRNELGAGGASQPAVVQQPAQQPGQQRQPNAQQPQQPTLVAGGIFEGSDLQRALLDRDYIRRAAVRSSVPDYSMPTYGYQQPPYPPYGGQYPSWYPYGGFGHFWGGFPSVIIIRKGHHGHHSGHHGGHHIGGGGVHVPSHNGQAIRHVASWAGRPPSHFVNVPGGTTASTITRPSVGVAGVGVGHAQGRR